MVATSLRAGSLAVISVNTDDPSGTSADSITFVLLQAVGSQTQIFFTDRAWTPTNGSSALNAGSFAAAGGGEGTYTYTAASNLPAGTIVTIPTAALTAAGINLSDLGDTLYVYQGSDANTPTSFLYALDIADGNTVFEESLVNTGLTLGVHTAAIDDDNATYGDIGHNTNIGQLLLNISDTTNNWATNVNSPQLSPSGTTPVSPAGTGVQTVPGAFFDAPTQSVWAAISGGGAGIARIYNDGNNVGVEQVVAFQNSPTPPTQFNHPNDIVFDTVHGLFFVADSDTGNRRILQGKIADLFNPGLPAPPLTVLWTDQSAGIGGGQVNGIAIDVDHATGQGAIYFVNQTNFNRIVYNHSGTTSTQTPTLLANLGAGQFANEIALDIGRNRAFVLSTESETTAIAVPPGTPGAIRDENVPIGDPGAYYIIGTDITNNEIYMIGGLDRADTGTGGTTVSKLDLDLTTAATDLPDAKGLLQGMDVDTTTGLLYFVTQQINLGVAGEKGGIYRIDPTTNLQTLLYEEGNSTDYGFEYIDVDSATGRYYVSEVSFADINGGNGNGPNTSSILTGTIAGGTPTVFAQVGNVNASGPLGLIVNNAPTLTGIGNPNLAVTEASSARNSGETSRVTLFSALVISDIDTPNTGDEIAGARVRISGNLQTGLNAQRPSHQDLLTIGGSQSGTTASGITYSYDLSNGTMTLSGPATVGEYKTALESVQFSTSGDDITAYGTAPNRTIALSVFDGLDYSDEISATVSVTAINDAPENTPGAAMTYVEDTTGNAGSVVIPLAGPVNAVTGIIVFDVDADPAVDEIEVILSVNFGTLKVRTDVAGGPAIEGNNTGTVVLAGTQNEINALLSAMSPLVPANSQGNPLAIQPAPNGVVYTPPANFNGAAVLTITTSDYGNEGNDPANGTGGPTDEADIDTKVLNVTDVNDAPTVGGDGTEVQAAILEDVPLTSGTAPTVASIFGGQFADLADVQRIPVTNTTGSPGDTLAGIAITGGTTSSLGTWQYLDGATWTNIGAASASAARTISAMTQIRFNPVLNQSGDAPQLVVRLIESSSTAIVNNGTIDLTAGPDMPGGTSRVSIGAVTLDQAVTPVNDAPVLSQTPVTDPTYVENSAVIQLLAGGSVADVDAVNFAGGSLTVTVSGTNNSLALPNADGFSGFGVGSYLYQGTRIADYANVTGGIALNNFTAAMTPAVMNLLLNNFTYQATGDNPGGADRIVTYTLNDGGNTGTGGAQNGVITQTVHVTPVNDIPVVTTSANPTAFAEGVNAASVATAVDPGIFLADPDNISFASATVAITTNFEASDVLGFVNSNATTFGNIAVVSYSGGVLTLSSSGASATIAQWQSALRAVTYTSSSEEPSELNRTVSFKVNDGALESLAGTKVVLVDAQNDSPSGTSKTISINEDAVRTLSAADFGFSDVDGDAFRGVRFGTAPTGGKLFYDADGANSGAAPVAIASYPTGDYLAADIALGKLTFVPEADANGLAKGTITFTVIDEGGTAGAGQNADTTPNVLTVDIASVNDEPVGQDKVDVAIDEDQPHTFSTADFAFSDPIDGDEFAGVEIVTLATAGTLTLNGIAISSGAFVSAQDIEDGKFEFRPAQDASGNDYASFTFRVVDDGGAGADRDSTPNTFSFDVTAINDAPTIAGLSGDTVTYTEGDGTKIIDLGANALVGDVDSANFDGGLLQFIFESQETGDRLILTLGNGISLGAPQPPFGAQSVIVDSVTIGTLAPGGSIVSIELNGNATAALVQKVVRAVTYTNTAGLNLDDNALESGTRTVNYSLTDGDGGTDTGSVTINLVGINDAPSGTDNTVVASEDDPYTFTWADFGFSDPVDGDDALGVRIDELPVKGTLVLDGVAVTDGQVISKGAIDDGDLKFVPAADQFGTGYASFKFSVRDDGGTDNGGVEFDQSANTMTVDVTADNQAPSVDLDADGAGTGFASSYTEGGAAAAIGDTDVDITDPDAVDDIVSATITITNANAGDKLNVGTLPATVTVDASSTDTIVKLVAAAGTSAADFEAAIEAVTFSNSSDDPTDNGSNMERTITVTVNDGDVESAAATVKVTVTDVNDAPTGTDATITAVEDSFRALTLADFGFSDADGSFESVTISAVTGGKIYYDDDGAAGPDAPEEVTLPATYFEQALTDGKVLFKANQDVNGAATGTITFAVTDDDGAAAAASNVLTVDVTAVNDDPVAGADTLKAVEDTQVTYQGSDLTANDSDVDNDALTVTGVSNPTGGTAVRNDDGSVTFTPTANFNRVGGFDYTISDGKGGTSSARATVNIGAVNDAPTVVIGSGLSAAEQVAFDLKGKVTVGDVDSGTGIISATLTATHGILTATSGTSGATVGGSGTATLTITGTASQIDALLVGDATSTITFTSSSDAPPASANLTVTVNDRGNTSSSPNLLVNGGFETQDGANVTRDYIINGPGGISGTANGAYFRTAENLFGWQRANSTVYDLETNNNNAGFNTGDGTSLIDMETGSGQNLSLFQDVAGIAEGTVLRLSLFAALPVEYSAGASGQVQLQVLWNGQVVGTISPTSTVMSEYVFNVTAPLAGTGASGANRLQLVETGTGGSDGRGTQLDAVSLRVVNPLSASDSEAIAISAVNDAPSLTAPTAAKIGYSEQAAGGTALMQGVVLSDVDLPANFAGGSIGLTVSGSEGGINLRSGSAFVINSNGADGTFSLARQEGPTQVGIGLISGIGTTNVQITNLISPANLERLNDLLNEFVFIIDSDTPTEGDRTVTLTFNDGGNTGGGGLTDAETQTLTVTPVNDAPVNAVPAAQTGTEDVALVFSAANSNAITISDADIGPGIASVLLSVGNGTLTLGDTTDLAQPPVGNGTGTVALVGTVTAINQALEGLSYLGALNSNGTRTLTISTSDNGFTGPNLIVNPGAETGARADDYSSSVVPSGWTRVDSGGSFTALDYDVPGQASSDLDENDSADVEGGNGYFAGGPSTPGTTAIRQTIDVSGSAAAIDSGTLLANLSGVFGGYLGVNDRMTMTARYLDGTGVQLATTTIGGVTAAERGGETLLLPQFGVGQVPVGTRSIEIVLTAIDSGDGNYGNGYADNVSLVLSQLVSNTVSIDLAPVDDAPVAVDDVDTADENTIATGNVFDDNGSGPDSDVDGPALSVAEVNGQAADVGQTITLGSGAKLTLNSDGSYSYDPNGKYVTLTDNSSGAVNTADEDSFNYTLTNGNTATVTITINGVAGPGDRLAGDATDNTITGTPQGDFFLLQQGGNDKASGLAGNDNFYIGGAMTSDDEINGGGGSDTLALQGNYAALTLGAGVIGLELIALMPGSDTRFGLSGKGFFSYNITSVDENVAEGTQLNIDAGRLREDENFTFNGSAETNGFFRIAGGFGVEDLTGGARSDAFLFAPGSFGASDRVNGGGGNDQLALRGDYNITFGSSQLTSIEFLVLLSGRDVRENVDYDYAITTSDGNVAAGQRLGIDAAQLRAEESLAFNGSAETNGFFRVAGGDGTDSITGGSGNDIIEGRGRGDTLTGGGGNDIFLYRSVDHSNSIERDGIQDFSFGDLVDLSQIDANTNTAENEAFTFISNAAFSGTAGELRFENISLGGPVWMVQGDVDGNGISDIEIVLVINPPDPITASDFIL
jgi:hypothetical protein